MGQQSAVDRAAMKQAADDIDASANIIKGLQTQLEGHKQQVRSAWEGNASMAFESVFNRFNEDFGKVLRALEGMHQSLVQTKITYESKEEMSEQAVNKVQALLNGTT
ncbi:WXG100 family type VII secretion target [Actinomadura formosensis]|uniref:WXG100 family type VII secretion target n=1 Tax=Actinomadura formosensis TaxID=60706 RepID=UPI000A0476DB|nr:WXG100 family type VII secretion target [Actinomadura formosensis]